LHGRQDDRGNVPRVRFAERCQMRVSPLSCRIDPRQDVRFQRRLRGIGLRCGLEGGQGNFASGGDLISNVSHNP
jgi:hypothetical protein